MVERKSDQPIPRLPGNALEQLAQLPTREEQKAIMDRLSESINVCLTKNGITLDEVRSTHRVKTQDRIVAKLRRRGTGKLILDIYALRLILPADQIYPALDVIDRQYPTPEYFPGDFPSLRDYNDPDIPWNPLRQDDYRAVHKNIVFIDGGNIGIAEIQLMTPEQLEVAECNRAAYDAKREAFEKALEFFG